MTDALSPPFSYSSRRPTSHPRHEQTLELRFGFATYTSPQELVLAVDNVDNLHSTWRPSTPPKKVRQRRLDRVVGLARRLSILLFVPSLSSLFTLASVPRLPRTVRVDIA